MIILEKNCIVCRMTNYVKVTKEQYERLQKMNETGEHIQQVLPNHSEDERELLISGMCPTCWNNLFDE